MFYVCLFFLMIRRPPRSTRTTHSFPTRRSSDLRHHPVAGDEHHREPARPRYQGRLRLPRTTSKLPDLGERASLRSLRQLLMGLCGRAWQHGGDLADRGLLLYFRSEEHTSELQSLMRNSYAVCCFQKTNTNIV